MPDVLTMVARLQDETQGGFQNIRRSMLDVARGGSLRELTQKLREMTQALTPFTNMIKDSLMPTLNQLGITSLTTAGAIGGLYFGMQKFAQSTMHLRTLSAQTNIAIDDLEKARFVAKELGVSAATMDAQLSHLAVTTLELAGGRDKRPVGAAAALEKEMALDPKTHEMMQGLIEHAQQHPGDTFGIFKLILDPEKGIGKFKDPGFQAIILRRFGLDQAFTADFIARLAKAPESVRGMIEVAEKFNKTWLDFARAGEDFANIFFNSVGSVLTSFLETATDDIREVWRALYKLEQALTYIMPQWLKDLIGWTGNAISLPPELQRSGGFGMGYEEQGPELGQHGEGQGGPGIPGSPRMFPDQPAPRVEPGSGEQGAAPAGETRLGEAGAHGFARGNVHVAPWLVDTVRQASKALPEGYRAEVISSVDPRGTGTPWHPSGRAIDIQIFDPQGKKVPYIGDPSVPGWKIYEDMAIAARQHQMEKYPEQKFIWGGHFNSGTPYDRMHFQSGGVSARDFTPEQLRRNTPLTSAPPSDAPPLRGDSVYGWQRSKGADLFGGRTPGEFGWGARSDALDGALWSKSGQTKVEGTGSLTVDVTAPPGTKVDAEAGGMFDETTINRRKTREPEMMGE